MFDIGWSEMAIIAVVALVVIGPKELPNALKTVAYWMTQARKMAREFQSGVDEMCARPSWTTPARRSTAVTGRNRATRSRTPSIPPAR